MHKKQKVWSNLPNAHHIDWVLASLKDNAHLWAESWRAASDEAWSVARDTASNAASNAASHAVWVAASDAALALIAYDDCDEYLSMGYEELKTWAALNEHPAAVLLLSMVYVKAHTLELSH